MSQETEHSTQFQSSPPPSVTSQSGTFPPAGGRLRQPTIHPQDLAELTENYSIEQPANFSPESSISGKIADLEEWALTIAKHERRDVIRFWILKGLSFFAAVATATGGALQMPRLAISAGIVAAIAIAVDAAWPVSGDRNARRRAVHDLRELQHTIKLKWEKVCLAHPDPLAIKRVAHALALLDSTQSKREQIGRYLGEASPAVSDAKS